MAVPPHVSGSVDPERRETAPPMTFPDKQTIRREARAARDAFVASNPIALSPPRAITDRFAPGMTVAAYLAIGSEADPAAFVAAARAAGAGVALPYVEGRSAPMRFLEWREDTALVAGPFGLVQPAPDSAEVAPEIFLTPLVAYDRTLHRLGQGAGFYDRAFARFPDAWRVGIAWSAQEVAAVPTDPWDVPLHALINEHELLERGDR